MFNTSSKSHNCYVKENLIINIKLGKEHLNNKIINNKIINLIRGKM